MADLASKKCVPCAGGVPPLQGEELNRLQEQLGGNWKVVDGHHLEKEFTLPTFRANINFVNRVADLAEQQDHHPGIHIDYRRTKIEIWTHKINGLTQSDFVLAAKIDKI